MRCAVVSPPVTAGGQSGEASTLPVPMAYRMEKSVSVTPFFNWVHRHNTGGGAVQAFYADAGGWQQAAFIRAALVTRRTGGTGFWRSPSVI